MNRFITLLALSLSLILNSSTLSAIKVNGKETSGEFTYENPAGTKHVAFKFDATGITVTSIEGMDQQADKVPGLFKLLTHLVDSSPAVQENNGPCFFLNRIFKGQSVALKSTPGLSFESCIVESPSAVLTANDMQFENLFVQSANPLTLKTELEAAIVKEVKLFPIDADSPMFVLGVLNFANCRTGDLFVVTGTRKVWMKL